MLPVDLPTRDDILALAATRADACASIYVETTPVSTEIAGARIAFRNAAKAAAAQLEAAGADKRRVAALLAGLEDIAADDDFWAHQARTLAAFATPDRVCTYRLASRVQPTTQVSDRFHLKPLLRAASYGQAAFVLALSEKGARLVEVFADMPAVEVRVPGMPDGAASAVGKASISDRSHEGQLVGSEGKKRLLAKWARAAEAAIRPILSGNDAPLVLAANSPMAEIYRGASSLPTLLPAGFGGEVDRMSPRELAEAARPILDAARAARIAALRAAFETREAQGRATLDVAVAARAAARGAIETLLIDMDAVVPGEMDAETGEVRFAAAESAASYGVTDAIAMRAFATGAEVVAARAADLPGPGPLAATLRYAI